MLVAIKKLHPNAIIPEYQSELAAGLDLHACIDEPISLFAGNPAILVPTGVAVHMDPHTPMAAMIYPRSGLGTRGLVLANGTGVIDADYQGELKVSAINRRGPHDERGIAVTAEENKIVINPGDRIAQLVFMPIYRPELALVDEFSVVTERGENGLGSTGVKAA